MSTRPTPKTSALPPAPSTLRVDTRKLYIDMAAWEAPPKPDDFLVAVGKTKSNSVYHVATVRAVPHKTLRAVRYHLQVYRSDLLAAIRRDKEQRIIVIKWHTRSKR
jgi:hypothetical protein